MCWCTSGDLKNTPDDRFWGQVNFLPTRRDPNCLIWHLGIGEISGDKLIWNLEWDDIFLMTQNQISDSGDAHTTWNHLEALKWAQMVPNTRYCHTRQLEEEPARTTQIWYLRNRYSALGPKLKNLSTLPDAQWPQLHCPAISPTEERLCELEVILKKTGQI